MREIFSVTGLIAVLTLNFVPFLLAWNALAPQRLSQAVRAAAQMPGRALVLGFVNFAFFTGLGLGLFTLADRVNGLLKGVLLLPALLILLLLGLLLSLGLGAVAQLIGDRLAPAQSPWRRAVWGTLLLGLGGALPLVGWLLLLPYAGGVGLGAVLLGFFQRPPVEPAPRAEG